MPLKIGKFYCFVQQLFFILFSIMLHDMVVMHELQRKKSILYVI